MGQSIIRGFKKIYSQLGGGLGTAEFGYKAYVASISQTGTDAPVATVLYNNLPLGTPVWTRVSAGIYRATLTGSFLEAKTHISFGVSLGATRTIAQVLYGATGIEGYIYFDRESDNILRLTTTSALNVPTEISTLIGTGLIMLPEVRVYS
jgi:hypothetical protein